MLHLCSSKLEGAVFTYGRWLSYFHQINETVRLASPGDAILEIGPGEYVYRSTLTHFGFDVTTVDIDESKQPDIVGDVRELDLPPSSYDVVVAFQVLEHVPYEHFKDILRTFLKITREYCIISLPAHGHWQSLTLKLPRIKGFPPFSPFGRRWSVGAILCLHRPAKKRPLPYHQWEIGRRGYSLARIKADIIESGFHVSKIVHTPDHPAFFFFVLNKDNG